MSARPVAAAVAAWDAALAAVRDTLRGQGLAEVTTPVRLDAVALEPWIEPVAAEHGWLATSPELPMKRLLCRGAPPIFQVAHCFRGSERGAMHREEFHLVEWYRHGEDLEPIRGDVQRLWTAVATAVGQGAVDPDPAWTQVAWLDAFATTVGVALTGREDAAALHDALARVRPAWAAPLAEHDDDGDADTATLRAWSTLVSLWSDDALDPWLASRGTAAVHLVDFPAPLCALAQLDVDAHGRAIAHRFESYLVHDGAVLELANGYRELRDPEQQARRFATVADLRAQVGLPARPIPEAFLADLRGFGLPPCAGAALGLDRLLAAACGARDLAALDLGFGAPR